jgi:hypothetical protein
MIFCLYTNNGALNSQPVFHAFAKSVVDAGHTVIYNEPYRVGDHYRNYDVAVIWSVLWHGRMAKNKTVWEQNRLLNRPVIVLEVGALNRGTMWKVGVNGINRDAYFAPKNNNNERANMLGLKMQPWTHNEDGHIVICLQHNKSQQWANMPPQDKWLDKTLSTIRKRTDRPIVIRPHPRCPIVPFADKYENIKVQHPKKNDNTYDDYEFDMSNAYAVISWSSNPAIHAVLQGVPAFTGPSSLAYDVAQHDIKQINNPIRPDRTQWLNDLAHTEYSTHEIAAGYPLKHLTSQL